MENIVVPEYNCPEDWVCIETVEMHTGGEPLRIPVKGLPKIEGNSILEARRYFRDNFDHLRTSLMFEPRGHADMYGAILTQPMTVNADFGTFFVHNEGYSTMCGHAIIALTKFAYETGLVSRNKSELLIDAPPGLIKSRATFDGDEVVKTTFLNVDSFVLHADQEVEVQGIGKVKFDVSYGGAFYAIVDAQQFDIRLDETDYNKLIDWGRRIKNAVMETYEIKHPFEEDLSFLYGTIFTGKAHTEGNHSRNVCIFAEGEVDRSATGSGVSARAALHHMRGEISVGEEITIESILGTTMTVSVKEETSYGGYRGVIPEVSGNAHFCGKNESWIDPHDPLKDGFIFR